MYAGPNSNSVELTINEYSSTAIEIAEKIDMSNVDSDTLLINNIKRIFDRQYSLYKTKFRDGQYTKDRELCIKKEMQLILGTTGAAVNTISIKYLLSKDKSKFTLDLSETKKYSTEAMAKNIANTISDLLYNEDVEVVGVKEAVKKSSAKK